MIKTSLDGAKNYYVTESIVESFYSTQHDSHTNLMKSIIPNKIQKTAAIMNWVSFSSYSRL